MGPLEELIIDGCDIRSYLPPFLDLPEARDIKQPAAFPRVKELTIAHPYHAFQEECVAAIVRLARSQHALGVPFEHVTICMTEVPKTMAEELEPWIGAADCYEGLDIGDFLDQQDSRI